MAHKSANLASWKTKSKARQKLFYNFWTAGKFLHDNSEIAIL